MYVYIIKLNVLFCLHVIFHNLQKHRIIIKLLHSRCNIQRTLSSTHCFTSFLQQYSELVLSSVHHWNTETKKNDGQMKHYSKSNFKKI